MKYIMSNLKNIKKKFFFDNNFIFNSYYIDKKD